MGKNRRSGGGGGQRSTLPTMGEDNVAEIFSAERKTSKPKLNELRKIIQKENLLTGSDELFNNLSKLKDSDLNNLFESFNNQFKWEKVSGSNTKYIVRDKNKSFGTTYNKPDNRFATSYGNRQYNKVRDYSIKLLEEIERRRNKYDKQYSSGKLTLEEVNEKLKGLRQSIPVYPENKKFPVLGYIDIDDAQMMQNI